MLWADTQLQHKVLLLLLLLSHVKLNKNHFQKWGSEKQSVIIHAQKHEQAAAGFFFVSRVEHV